MVSRWMPWPAGAACGALSLETSAVLEQRTPKFCLITTFRMIAGETEKPCTLVLTDDTFHEEEEELRLVLGTPRSDSSFGASIGEQNETLIKIRDDADSKRIAYCYWLLEAHLCALKPLFFS